MFRLGNFERITLVCDNHLHPQGREFIEESTIDFLSKVWKAICFGTFPRIIVFFDSLGRTAI